MSDYLDQIEQRAGDALRNREMYSKDSRSRRITNEESAKDVPRLLVAIRAVETRLRSDLPDSDDHLDDWERGHRAALLGIRRALTNALEGEQ